MTGLKNAKAQYIALIVAMALGIYCAGIVLELPWSMFVGGFFGFWAGWAIAMLCGEFGKGKAR